MKQKSKVYPYFVANQVLKSKSLNDAFFHLDEQGRVTRSNLFGHGILEGLNYTWKDGVLTINPGEAITSNGWYIHFTGKEEYRYAAEVFLGENPSEEEYPFNDDSLLALLKYGGSRVCYACFKTEEEAHEFHHKPTRIIEIPSAHYVVALACGTRNHSRSACTEDSCDINVTQKDCEVWPVLVNIWATFDKEDKCLGFAQVPDLFKKMEPCFQRVQLDNFYHLSQNQKLKDLQSGQRYWIDNSLSIINAAAVAIATQILGQKFDLRETFKVQKSVWKDLFDKPREVIGRFDASVKRVINIFSNSKPGYPDYCQSFLKDYADAMKEFIEEYNVFIAKHPYIPLRDPMDCLVYLGSARHLDQTGATDDQTFRSHFLKAHDDSLKEDSLRLERFLRRISLLSEAFVGTSWNTLASVQKICKMVPCRPGAKISDRPIPFYYKGSYENFKECWRAGNISQVSSVRDYDDDSLPYMLLYKNNSYQTRDGFLYTYLEDGMDLYIQGYQGMSVDLFKLFINSCCSCNNIDVNVESIKLLSKKDLQKNPYISTTGNKKLYSETIGGLARTCTVYVFHYKGKVVTYSVRKFVK